MNEMTISCPPPPCGLLTVLRVRTARWCAASMAPMLDACSVAVRAQVGGFADVKTRVAVAKRPPKLAGASPSMLYILRLFSVYPRCGAGCCENMFGLCVCVFLFLGTGVRYFETSHSDMQRGARGLRPLIIAWA